jgi:RNA-directed DNA polymerase
MDMMALKLITKALFRSIKIPSSCHHTKGNGGLKKAVQKTSESLMDYTYVFRSDVKSFYESINFDVLMGIVESYVKDPVLLTLLKKALMRAENCGGNFTFYDTQYHFNQSAFAKAPARHSVSHTTTRLVSS